MKYSLYTIILAFLITWQLPCHAHPKNTVNIIAWYMYLRSPKIASAIKEECGVDISYDEYYSSNECLRRISTVGDFHYYDIVIFPSDIYELIKKKIGRENSSLNKVAQLYHNDFKKHYLAHNYPSNVAYFVLSLSGFIWNPLVIQLSSNDPILSIFKKAQNNVVIIMDNYIGTWNLIDNHRQLPLSSLAEVFRKTSQDTDVYITNGYNVLYGKNNFAFAFQRSGESIFTIKATKNQPLNFLVHQVFSYISPDLLAELNTKPETQCVAKVLTSKKILDIVQKETFYLSPYGTYKSVNDPLFQSVYAKLFDASQKIRWLDSFFTIDQNEVMEIRYMWDNIHLLPKIMKNHTLVLRYSE